MKQFNKVDILVAGNGPIGKIAALALADCGFTVAIVGPKGSAHDHRTTALMMPAINVLMRLNVWEKIAPQAGALRTMRIIDATKHLFRAPTVTFHAAEIGEDSFGWNMPNKALNNSLDEQISNKASIQQIDSTVLSYEASDKNVVVKLDNGAQIEAKLIAGADGRNSLSRDTAGVKTSAWTYPQTAFVTAFDHKLPHEDISTEFHTQSGPFVQVPLPGNRSSLVWVGSPAMAAHLMELDDGQLSLEIEKQMFSILGKVTATNARQCYPLSGQYPDKFAQNRVALLGEAAHVFPPIGAQGLNLGIRDVEDLAAAAVSDPTDPGAIRVLDLYNNKRRPDIMARVAAVDLLNRSLLSTLLPTQFARAAGLAFLDSAAPIRGLFMREGMRPGDGINSFFGSLQKVFSQKRT